MARRSNNQKGFSLIAVMISVVIITSAAFALSTTISGYLTYSRNSELLRSYGELMKSFESALWIDIRKYISTYQNVGGSSVYCHDSSAIFTPLFENSPMGTFGLFRHETSITAPASAPTWFSDAALRCATPSYPSSTATEAHFCLELLRVPGADDYLDKYSFFTSDDPFVEVRLRFIDLVDNSAVECRRTKGVGSAGVEVMYTIYLSKQIQSKRRFYRVNNVFYGTSISHFGMSGKVLED